MWLWYPCMWHRPKFCVFLSQRTYMSSLRTLSHLSMVIAYSISSWPVICPVQFSLYLSSHFVLLRVQSHRHSLLRQVLSNNLPGLTPNSGGAVSFHHILLSFWRHQGKLHKTLALKVFSIKIRHESVSSKCQKFYLKFSKQFSWSLPRCSLTWQGGEILPLCGNIYKIPKMLSQEILKSKVFHKFLAVFYKSWRYMMG